MTWICVVWDPIICAIIITKLPKLNEEHTIINLHITQYACIKFLKIIIRWQLQMSDNLKRDSDMMKLMLTWFYKLAIYICSYLFTPVWLWSLSRTLWIKFWGHYNNSLISSTTICELILSWIHVSYPCCLIKKSRIRCFICFASKEHKFIEFVICP